MSLLLQGVSFSYPGGPEVLKNISVHLEPSDVLLVVGHNGAGKSSLLKLLNGTNRPTAGDMILAGTAAREKTRTELSALASVTFQNPSDQIFASTVLKETEYGPRNLRRHDPRNLALQALEMFRLAAVQGMHPYDLSPAERKLLTLASAVAMQTPILAFDEPSVPLSQPERSILLNALASLIPAGRTLLIVSHDLELFLPMSTKVLVLNRGTSSFIGTPRELLHQDRRLREAGLRLPLSFRLRPYAGLTLLPAPSR